MPSNGGREDGGPALPSLRAAGPAEPRRRNRLEPRSGASDDKNKARVQHQTRTEIRRTLSLDAILAPYLQGQWPREGERRGQSGHRKNDKFSQPSNWRPDKAERSSTGSHKRSASLGNGDHLRDIAKLKQQLQAAGPINGIYVRERHHHPMWVCAQSQPVPIPLSSLTNLPSTMRRSEERLDQELERAFTHQSPIQLSRLLEIPDGHRAPVPSLSSNSSSRCESSFTTHPTSQSPSSSSASPHSLTELDTDFSAAAQSCPSPLLSSEADAALLSCSPRPNKSYCFQREPPEGCERVRVCEENISLYKNQPNLLSCPDPNKVNFTPYGGSAFCPVSLLKPLLPSVDFLFRSLSVSPGTCWAGHGGACQPQSPAVTKTGYMGSLETATTAIVQ
ncbi:protein FAM117A isoform X1 [Astyanax mexicanus]|uniref:Cytochrome c oxidase subunit NDUFA4 n=2 Tax=Astyanax mexicanus TaxID=7994 RepID=A0A8B9L355_ASTMX|nr:protein FAM117A isoform X1 [Astyanax mexicanus]